MREVVLQQSSWTLLSLSSSHSSRRTLTLQLALSLHDSHIADTQTRRACVALFARALAQPDAAEKLLRAHGLLLWVRSQCMHPHPPEALHDFLVLVVAATRSSVFVRLPPEVYSHCTTAAEALWWAMDGHGRAHLGTLAGLVSAHLEILLTVAACATHTAGEASEPGTSAHCLRTVSASMALSLLDRMVAPPSCAAAAAAGDEAGGDWVALLNAADCFALPDGSPRALAATMQLMVKFSLLVHRTQIAPTLFACDEPAADTRVRPAHALARGLTRFARWIAESVCDCAPLRGALLGEANAVNAIVGMYDAACAASCAVLPEKYITPDIGATACPGVILRPGDDRCHRRDASPATRHLNRAMLLLLAERSARASRRTMSPGRSASALQGAMALEQQLLRTAVPRLLAAAGDGSASRPEAAFAEALLGVLVRELWQPGVPGPQQLFALAQLGAAAVDEPAVRLLAEQLLVACG